MFVRSFEKQKVIIAFGNASVRCLIAINNTVVNYDVMHDWNNHQRKSQCQLGRPSSFPENSAGAPPSPHPHPRDFFRLHFLDGRLRRVVCMYISPSRAASLTDCVATSTPKNGQAAREADILDANRVRDRPRCRGLDRSLGGEGAVKTRVLQQDSAVTSREEFSALAPREGSNFGLHDAPLSNPAVGSHCRELSRKCK